VARFRTALGRWRGEPLANLTIPLLDPELTRLTQDRLTVVEDCMDAELRPPGATPRWSASCGFLVEHHPVGTGWPAR